MEQKTKRLIVVVGPTGVGKTAIAIQLAQHFQTVVISADSRQFFQEMNIGTAKPSLSELTLIPHYFVNNLSIRQNYDAAQYGRDALKLIDTLFEQHDTLVLCGGSGLYVKAVCEGFDDIPQVQEELRMSLSEQYKAHGITWLQDKLKTLDEAYFNLIDQQNPHRLIRALEVKIGTGQSISTFRKNNKLEHAFSIVKIGLELNRDALYERIDSRMDKMIASGLFEEAEKLYSFKDHHALQTVGYQEVFDFIDGKYNKEEAIRLLKRNSRRYAKRQLTWFKRDPEIRWFDPDSVDAVLEWLRK